MKYKLFFISAFIISTSLFAQDNSIDIDKSPMDASYWPNKYPVLKLNGKTKDLPVARILYSRPQKNNRVIFDGIVKYGEMWRLGANEATEIEFFKNIKINNKTISKGRYTMYCLPSSENWTLIISKDNYCWGNYSYNKKNDVLRIDVPVEKNTEPTEALTAFFGETKTGANLIFMWDDVKVSLPIDL